MYPQYKAHRSEHPPGLTEAISRILAIVDALGIPVLSVPGAEADDVIGTLAVKAQQDGFGSVVIVSIDKVRSAGMIIVYWVTLALTHSDRQAGLWAQGQRGSHCLGSCPCDMDVTHAPFIGSCDFK